MAESHDPAKRLKKALGAFALVLLGIGVIIGAGIFTTVGTAVAGDVRGSAPAPPYSFFRHYGRCMRFCGVLCYAELASLVPISGSAYTYSYASFGELVAWIIGWDLMCEYTVGSIAVAISWSGYFGRFSARFGIIRRHGAQLISFGYARLPACRKPAAFHSRSSIPFWQHAWNAVQGSRRTVSACDHLQYFRGPHHGRAYRHSCHGIKASSRFNVVIVTIKLLVLRSLCW